MAVRTGLATALVVLCVPAMLSAQILVPSGGGERIRPPVHPPIHPPIRPIPRPWVSSYRIRSVNVQADLRDQVARIRMSQVFQNTGQTTLETSFLFPIPEDAAVSELTLLYDGKELPGRLLNKDEARRVYEEIVRRQRDPALMEYVGRGLFQTSVFPIPPNAERTVEIRYSQLLKKTDGLVDFMLPLGTLKHANHAIDSFTVSLRLETSDPIKTIYSPTHAVNFERPDDRHATAKLSLSNVTAPDDLRILHGTQAGPVGMSLVSFRPSEKEDGFFMLLASPERRAAAAEAAPKTAIIVIDRSGSMSGQKIAQAREAAKFFVHQLRPADTFNIIAYDSEVEAFRPELQRANPEAINAALSFAGGINAGGGTNIYGALTTALAMLKDDKRPSYLLFLTDGVPTVGEQNEMKIVAAAKAADKVHARIFNLGIGYDVNSRLLDRLSRDLDGQSAYVRPNENIETYVSALAKKIGTPLLTNVAVDFQFDAPPAAGTAAPISRTYPRKLTDLFVGEQLVWVGRYRKSGPVKVTLSGELAGKHETFTLTGNLADRSVGDSNGFVEKVWATRRIGEIIDEIDLHGQNRELIDELVQLSLKHGILTPYTSFLADDRFDLHNRDVNVTRASTSLDQLNVLDGRSGFEQRRIKGYFNLATLAPAAKAYPATPVTPLAGGSPAQAGGLPISGASTPTPRGSGDLPTQNTTVQSIGQKTFYWKNERWQDADVTPDGQKTPIRVKQFSPEYFALAAKDQGRAAKYFALEGPVLIVLEGKTYLIDSIGD